VGSNPTPSARIWEHVLFPKIETQDVTRKCPGINNFGYSFKAFQDFTTTFSDFSVLVGLAGKTTNYRRLEGLGRHAQMGRARQAGT